MNNIPTEETIQLRKSFKKYIEGIPAKVLGPLIVRNPGEEWRRIVLNEMIQKKVIDLSQEMTKKLKDYEYQKLASDNLTKLCVDHFNDVKTNTAAFDGQLRSLKDYWNENQISTFECPTKRQILLMIEEEESKTKKEEKLKHMTKLDFILLKMTVLT